MTKLTIIRNNELIHPHGFDIVIRNNNDVKNRENQSGWKPLFDAMWENLSPEQKAHVTHNNKNGKPFVFYNEVCDCFIPDKQDDGAFNYNTGDSDKRCICGVEIKYEYMIMNILTRITYKIGSTCIGHWNFKIAQQIKRDNRLSSDPESTFCPDCNRKNNKKKCGCEKNIIDTKKMYFNILKSNVECKKKVEIFQKRMRSIKLKRVIDLFRTNAYEYGRITKIPFGEYEQNFTCFEICMSVNPIFVNYLKGEVKKDKKCEDKSELIIINDKLLKNPNHTVDEDFEDDLQKRLEDMWKQRELERQKKKDMWKQWGLKDQREGWFQRSIQYATFCGQCKKKMPEYQMGYMKKTTDKWLFKCLDCYK